MRQNLDKNGLWSEFWRHVSFPRGGRGCWLWTGRINEEGYGKIDLYKRPVFAHHVAWALMRGEKHGLHLMHSCDVGKCVNPNHLSLGTNMDNVRDKMTKGRFFRGSVKLTGVKKQRAWEMRQRGMTQLAIGLELGVARNTVSKLLKKYVPTALPGMSR